ncbi:MAG: fumarylacetoacetate hydrolase family protein [Dehalococcoidia bacterium]|jgi:2-keto-4-pentenoate hydratase/2-oxohepta-3-ene-1,7-dioic acid hydratase in catechol pathway
MKVVRFSKDNNTLYGILEKNIVHALRGTPYRHIDKTGKSYTPDEVKLLSPCKPSKVVALGVNYRSHGEEMSHRIPEEPLIFIKPSTSVIGPEADIVYPSISQRVDYEGELGVVIGKRARYVPPQDTNKYIFGYTCVNDVTARDIQARDKQWTRGKGFDTFCPIGPFIETELNPGNLMLETRLNGERKQYTSTADLVFAVDELVSFISQVMTLLPGDVIATGTTAGVGPMQPDDMVEVEIEGIGILKNYVVKA